VGQGAFPGDQEFHGFLWKNGEKTDLGLLPGDFFSDTSVINSEGQIVGISGNATSSSAVLWESGQIVDLNTLVAGGSGLTLYWALYINDRGEIAAFGSDSIGNNHDVLLIPCDGRHPGIESCDYSLVNASAITSSALRAASGHVPPAALLGRNNRFHFPVVGPHH
jgi:probable HAF family extracellular repeat protein